MDGSGLERPFLWIFTDGSLIIIRNHDPFGKFFDGIRWPPADDDCTQAVLIKNVPDGFCLAGEIGDWADATGERIRLGKSVNAMFAGTFPGGNRRPKDRTKDGLKGSDVSTNTFFDELREVRH